MVERQDIDALLISALYGELTPAEESRLAAHLDSHPADRTALDDLTRAREVLHQSRILAVQYEPPQAISALLMQEASRRAPKKAAEGEGWFARFVRSFIQHPAMAAAAMIVVVVGASAIVSRNQEGGGYAETPPVETSQPAASAPVVAAETPDRAPAAAPSAGPMAADQFKVALADGEAKEDSAGDKNKEGGAPKALPETDPNVAFYDSNGKTKGNVAVAKPKPADTGLELRRRDAMPKDFDEAKPDPTPAPADEKLAKQEAESQTQRTFEGVVADDSVRGNREQAGYATDGRAGTATGSSSRAGAGGAPGAVAPTTPPTTAVQQAPRNATAPRTTPPPPPPPPPKATTAAPRQEIATDAPARDAQKSKEKVANDPNLAWARDQHAALVTAVRANNCGRAANIALSIANRAPAYYAQNVETDRSVKECIAYINNEREKDAELRAQRAKKTQLKNAEPAAPKRAADQPSRATNVDSK